MMMKSSQLHKQDSRPLTSQLIPLHGQHHLRISLLATSLGRLIERPDLALLKPSILQHIRQLLNLALGLILHLILQADRQLPVLTLLPALRLDGHHDRHPLGLQRVNHRLHPLHNELGVLGGDAKNGVREVVHVQLLDGLVRRHALDARGLLARDAALRHRNLRPVRRAHGLGGFVDGVGDVRVTHEHVGAAVDFDARAELADDLVEHVADGFFVVGHVVVVVVLGLVNAKGYWSWRYIEGEDEREIHRKSLATAPFAGK
ncbi:hypothetical protein BDY17DRAFT_300313 [Neohortaea acidophila]|uniref:Uncharacterized protein n=1 Tax=Neohortaea acidophila TaxID=245834 RepID=A0A6A6PQP1_9PEZI|nr:uncharacterized protein BDY17DRAFT_300313 [Neohortaea acidophila]KAF2482116.1 hypothetical protein BDY17DRAFT_300313 [Neohortaea acidophila]